MTDAPVMQATGLERHYDVSGGFLKKSRVLKAVGGLNFEVVPGKTLAIVGESGCGKSTLARMVAMIEEPTKGTLTLEGKEVLPENWADLRKDVQIVFQDPYGSLNPRQRIGTILMEPLVINTKMPRAEREAKAREILKLVGLRPEHFDRYPHMFSGGQRQRIAVARALMLDPELIVMYLGRAVEKGPKEALFAAPKHPYTVALLSATPQADPAKEKKRIKLEGELPSPLAVPDGCPFAPRCWKARDKCRAERPELGTEAHTAACFFPENSD